MAKTQLHKKDISRPLGIFIGIIAIIGCLCGAFVYMADRAGSKAGAQAGAQMSAELEIADSVLEMERLKSKASQKDASIADGVAYQASILRFEEAKKEARRVGLPEAEIQFAIQRGSLPSKYRDTPSPEEPLK